MATQNFFALLGDHENEDPAALIARYTADEKPQPKKAPAPARTQQAPASLPSKPLAPSEFVREAQRSQGRGGSRGGRVGFGERDHDRKESYHRSGENGFSSSGKGSLADHNDSNEQSEVGGYEGGRGGYQRGRGGYRGRGRGGSYGVAGEAGAASQEKEEIVGGDYEGARERGRGRGRGRGFGRGEDDQIRGREYDRRSGSGRGYEMKREGSGRYNWGTETDQHPSKEEVPGVSPAKEAKSETQLEQNTEEPTKDETSVEEGVPKAQDEDNEMTLDEYERVLEEKRKALAAMKIQERKVDADKSFQKMQLVDKKNAEDVFIKLGFDKEKGKKKEAVEKEDKAKKAVSINEFLKPVDGETYYGAGNGRGRGRGGGRGRFGGGYNNSRVSAPSIEDPGQFPTLSAN